MSDRNGVAAKAPEATGLLIIRAWIEEGSSEPLRAHLRINSDVSDDVESTVTLSRIDAVSDTVTDWLTQLLADAAAPDIEEK